VIESSLKTFDTYLIETINWQKQKPCKV